MSLNPRFMFSMVRGTHSKRHLKLKENQIPVIPLNLTTEHGSLSGNNLQNESSLFKLWLLSPFLYLCGFLDHMWLTFRKLNACRMQHHHKHTGFFIGRFLHFLSSFSIDDSLPSSYFTPGHPHSVETLSFPPASSAPFSFNLPSQTSTI